MIEMVKQKKVIETPEDVLEAVIFQIEKFPTEEFPVLFYEQRGHKTRCNVCHEEYDPQNPDEVELIQLKAVVLFNFKNEDGVMTIPHPWTSLYCKHCVLAVFGKVPDTGIDQMFQ